MAASHMAPIASRLLRLFSVCLAVGLVVTSAGCRTRRSAMRPVYVDPGIPATTGSSGSSSVILDESAPSKALPLIDTPDDDPRLSPARPQVDSKVNPSRGTSPPLSDEPGLQLPREERAPKANIIAPEMNPPKSSQNSTQGRSVSRSRQAGLQERVRPFVNDPEDLFQPPKADRPWKYIVVHHSASATGSYSQIDREHRKIQGWDGCGYHFVIGNGSESPDGQIEVARRWSNQKHGLHCRNGKNPDLNEYGIGICLIGDLDNAPPTPKQIAAAKALVAYLSQRYEIPGDHAGTHAELADSPTACPGKLFPEEQIFGSKHLAAN
jgi:N-acetyl-anhydromuramyl-L-alanine amidase AmpD